MALLGKVRLSISTVSIILLRFTTNIKTTLKIEFQRNVLQCWTKQNYRKLIKIYRLRQAYFHMIENDYFKAFICTLCM